ncbi:NADH dehydrogenase [ubiquinone] 1 beta subcomplex subunit 5, mitochondrial [Neodiprion pinetum]|uniref:NADH dehydrogenase [ubiquinone] 1 beta subcomplex subunit 5, mitochondrial n=1 Tax=Neodiprion lecontei TaxID=441921 RepID=A0A6J0BHG4_NEOLC|nr:NADH dehydrogenase [ubiquinone] 1 beta subcomplex subunit 5, mitochondrial [Neodiprion lecontei]XP_046480128.1 NADH dehydrogenase [ubiquinone] 1 beta subcomplex subunit 5, mitochondrial [Neodiprion pinetum]
MAVWSSMLRTLGQNIVKYRGTVPVKFPNNGAIRNMSDHGPRIFPLQPSRWQWNKTKDLFHFYMMLGLIPVAIIVTGSYIFIGPATLQEIPEGYVPKHWEYYRNPISRFLSRYIFTSHQQDYEKALHFLWEENEKTKLRHLEERVLNLMKDRTDYQAWYYRPGIAKYHRYSRKALEEINSMDGE